MHAPESLPVLASMMAASGTRWQVGYELIRWGDDAVPHIVALVSLSTDDRLEPRENTVGEDMIRAYLENWKQIPQPIDPRVVAAVRKSLEGADSRKSIRIEYHKEFLEKAAVKPAAP
jgi:hypothetical protein